MQCLQYPARISGTLFIFFRVEADNQFYYRLAYGRHFLVYNILQLLHTASIVSKFHYVSLNIESKPNPESMKLDLRIASRGNSTERGAGCCSSAQCCGYEWHGTTGRSTDTLAVLQAWWAWWQVRMQTSGFKFYNSFQLISISVV